MFLAHAPTRSSPPCLNSSRSTNIFPSLFFALCLAAGVFAVVHAQLRLRV